MSVTTEDDILRMIKNDLYMMDVIRATQTLGLPDWWVCAGFVRSKIWDTLHGFISRTPISDVDVIYYDPANCDENVEKEYEATLRKRLPDVPWSVKNEARMHLVNDLPPYLSAVDAISKFPETVTALGVKLTDNGELNLVAPHGVEDVVNFCVRPTPYFAETRDRLQIYEARLIKKNWIATWNRVRIVRE